MLFLWVLFFHFEQSVLFFFSSILCKLATSTVLFWELKAVTKNVMPKCRFKAQLTIRFISRERHHKLQPTIDWKWHSLTSATFFFNVNSVWTLHTTEDGIIGLNGLIVSAYTLINDSLVHLSGSDSAVKNVSGIHYVTVVLRKLEWLTSWMCRQDGGIFLVQAGRETFFQLSFFKLWPTKARTWDLALSFPPISSSLCCKEKILRGAEDSGS